MKIANTRNVSNLATASYNTVRSGGKFSAIAVCGTVDGKQVQLCSLPAHLNGNKLPGLRDLRGMIEGRSIVAAAYAIRTEPSRRIAADAQVRILGRAASVLDIVAIRARFIDIQEAFEVRHRVDENEGFDVMCAAWSDDKAVHAIEDAAFQMRMDCEAVHGTYAAHKAAFAPAPAVSLVKVSDSWLPAALVVFTSWAPLKPLHPTVADKYNVRKLANGAIYATTRTGMEYATIGPFATQAAAERGALAHLRSLPAIGVKADFRSVKVDLTKPAAPALQFAAPVFVDNRTNEQIMLDTLALIRHKRLALSTVYTVESDGVNMGSYLAESKPAALDACARAYAYASFAHMETCLGRTLNFEVFAEFVNPLTSRVPS